MKFNETKKDKMVNHLVHFRGGEEEILNSAWRFCDCYLFLFLPAKLIKAFRLLGVRIMKFNRVGG